MHISSSYAKNIGETKFQTREIPRSGSEAKDGEREKKKERLNDCNNNGQATHGARKLPGPKVFTIFLYIYNHKLFKSKLNKDARIVSQICDNRGINPLITFC